MKISTNKDGKRNLKDLRKALSQTKHSVYRQGNSWILSRNAGDCNWVSPAPYWADERQAIEMILGLECE